jgi:hypothetical protein
MHVMCSDDIVWRGVYLNLTLHCLILPAAAPFAACSSGAARAAALHAAPWQGAPAVSLQGG